MNKKIVNKGKLLILKKEHEGKWLALSTDYKKIIASSNDLISLTNKIGKQKVVITKGLSSDVSYAFSCLG
jgi:hypothetical protein